MYTVFEGVLFGPALEYFLGVAPLRRRTRGRPGRRPPAAANLFGVDPTVVSPGAIWWRDSRGYCLDCLMNSKRLKRRADQSSSIATWRTLSNPRLTQHLPAIVPIEIARIFLRRTFWVHKPQYASLASFRRELPRQAMEFGSLSHKGQGERECLHVFNATKHAHVTESANLLLERMRRSRYLLVLCPTGLWSVVMIPWRFTYLCWNMPKKGATMPGRDRGE
jgi:hypothetical protein